jgi:hypothetical protein
MTTGSADPATGLANLAVPEELRRAAGRLLVALGPVWDLLLRAKHLSVAAIGGGSPGLRRSASTAFVAHELLGRATTQRIGIPPRSVGGDVGQASSRAGNSNREDVAVSQLERNLGKGSIMRLSVDRICEYLIRWNHNGPLSFQRYIRILARARSPRSGAASGATTGSRFFFSITAHYGITFPHIP